MNVTTGFRRDFHLLESDKSGILRLDLVEKLPASEFSSIIRVLDDLYFANLWLGLAEAAVQPRAVPDFYAPNEKEKFYIKRLEIGTPNLIELIGLAQHVLPTFATVATALGATKALATLLHEIAGARQSFATARKTDVETELLKLDLRTKTSDLLAQGKITAEQARHKLATLEESEAFLQQVLPAYAHTPQFRLLETSVEKPVSRSDVPIARPVGILNRDIQARLTKLAGPGKESLVRAFIQAYQIASQRTDAESRERLRIAKEKLMASLGISEEHLESILQ